MVLMSFRQKKWTDLEVRVIKLEKHNAELREIIIHQRAIHDAREAALRGTLERIAARDARHAEEIRNLFAALERANAPRPDFFDKTFMWLAHGIVDVIWEFSEGMIAAFKFGGYGAIDFVRYKVFRRPRKQ